MVEEKPVLEVPKANSRAALAKNIGIRLRASRESIGMAQGEAARRSRLCVHQGAEGGGPQIPARLGSRALIHA